MATKNDLAAYEIHDVVGLEDAAERGRGLFGAVYKVEAFGVPCVAKCLHEILIGYQQQGPMKLDEKGADAMRSKFREECILHSQLRHPNIVQFLGVYYGMYSGELALIVEQLRWDLGEFVETYKEIPESIKVAFLLDVSYGLMYLHNRNPPIIHRDLSAGNVLISGEGKAKIADLGASKILTLSAFQAHTVGQPGALAYMPPEALQPNPQYDQSFDVFSFGAVALYTATQKFPMVYEISPSVEEFQNGLIQFAKRKMTVQLAKTSCLLSLIKNCLYDNPRKRLLTSKLCIELKKLASQNPQQSGEFSSLLDKIHSVDTSDAIVHELQSKLSQLQEELKQKLELQKVQRQHIQKMGAERQRMDLELATLREKVIGYQQEFESMAPLRNEVEHLRVLTAQRNEEIKNLTEDNADLTTQFQTLLENSDKSDPETALKVAEYDVLMERYHELQIKRISLENELQPLQEERAKILWENAQLREVKKQQDLSPVYTRLFNPDQNPD